MPSKLSPTDVAFIMAGLAQAVPAVLWWLCARMVPDSKRATAYWSGYAALSALSFVFLVAAMRQHESMVSEQLRAVGNVFNVLAVMALQRGIWVFIGRQVTNTGHWLAIAVMLVVSWFGLDSAAGAIRVSVLCTIQTLLIWGIALDLYKHGRDVLKLRWPFLLALPVVVAGVTFAMRGLRALFWPDAVMAEMIVDSTLNVASAFVYIVVTLSFHAILLKLVIGRLVADLHGLSRHDALTGLLNRRALEDALNTQVQRSRRNGEAFCTLMIDVDHFKNVNDRYGHAVGDNALKHLAGLMRGHLREVDRVGRFGGEEFVAVLPGLDLLAAVAVAERLRELVAATPMAAMDIGVALSISIGIAQWSEPQEEASRLLVRADAALYQAKLRGRDRVEWAGVDPLPA